MSAPPSVHPGDPLTERQLAVLRLTANGHTINSAARQLHITPNGVSSHLHRAYKKLGAVDKAHAVALAIATRQLHPREITITAPLRSAA